MTRVKRLMMMMVLVAVLAGCSAAQPTPQVVYVTPSPQPSASAATHMILGSVDVPGSLDMTDASGQSCTPDGALGDLRAGANVVIADGSGTVLATASLTHVVGTLTTCSFAFRASTPEAPFLHVRIGGHDGPTTSLADLRAAGWRWPVALSRGGG